MQSKVGLFLRQGRRSIGGERLRSEIPRSEFESSTLGGTESIHDQRPVPPSCGNDSWTYDLMLLRLENRVTKPNLWSVSGSNRVNDEVLTPARSIGCRSWTFTALTTIRATTYTMATMFTPSCSNNNYNFNLLYSYSKL
jgi:hypothetical protein